MENLVQALINADVSIKAGAVSLLVIPVVKWIRGLGLTNRWTPPLTWAVSIAFWLLLQLSTVGVGRADPFIGLAIGIWASGIYSQQKAVRGK